jgi:hypothetical protein
VTRARVAPQVATLGDAAYVSVSGFIDERFPGFGRLDGMTTVVIDLAGVSMMSSFGVRQWLRAMAAIPPSAAHIYLINCPPIIVDQLNMILNFGGRAKLVSMSAPFVCTKCGAESRETINVLGERADIEQGKLALRACKKCASPLELDEILDSYFACVAKYGAEALEPVAAQLIAQGGTLRKQAVVPSIKPATTNPSEGAPATLRVAEATPATTGRSYVGLIAIALVVLLLAAGAYVLFGPR